jgi:Tfp pilus assembly protein PilZ
MIDHERRKHPRYPVKMPVTVTHQDESYTVLVKDICQEAVFVEVERAPPLGSEVAVTFGLPGKDGPLRVGGRVVRIGGKDEPSGPGIAILFNEMTPADKVRLDFFIALQGGTPA